jgi:hypothetical protein
MGMRWLVLVGLLFALGCETRPTCEVVCSNQVRCGFSPEETACISMCNASIASSTMDCRVATDAYHRCWSNAGSCPTSPTTAAPGCADQLNDMRLTCTAVGPGPLLQSDGI